MDSTVSLFLSVFTFSKSLDRNICVGLFKVSNPGSNEIKSDKDLQSYEVSSKHSLIAAFSKVSDFSALPPGISQEKSSMSNLYCFVNRTLFSENSITADLLPKLVVKISFSNPLVFN